MINRVKYEWKSAFSMKGMSNIFIHVCPKIRWNALEILVFTNAKVLKYTTAYVSPL